MSVDTLSKNKILRRFQAFSLFQTLSTIFLMFLES